MFSPKVESGRNGIEGTEYRNRNPDFPYLIICIQNTSVYLNFSFPFFGIWPQWGFFMAQYVCLQLDVFLVLHQESAGTTLDPTLGSDRHSLELPQWKSDGSAYNIHYSCQAAAAAAAAAAQTSWFSKWTEDAGTGLIHTKGRDEHREPCDNVTLVCGGVCVREGGGGGQHKGTPFTT